MTFYHQKDGQRPHKQITFLNSPFYLCGTVGWLRGAVGSVRTTEPVWLRAAAAGTHRAVTLARPGAGYVCTSSYYLQYDYFSLVKATVVTVVGLLSMAVDMREDTSSVSKTFILGFSCRCFSSASTTQTR